MLNNGNASLQTDRKVQIIDSMIGLHRSKTFVFI